MKLSEAFPSRFLKAEDLDVPVTDKILDVRQELVGDDSKLVAHFVKSKGLVLNKTNGAIIHLRRQQVLDGLSILRGNPSETITYSPTGSETTAMAGRSLTEA